MTPSFLTYMARLTSNSCGRDVGRRGFFGDRGVIGSRGGYWALLMYALKLSVSQDYDLSAVYMRNWDTRDEFANDKGCEWEKDWEDVQRVCKQLGVPCELVRCLGCLILHLITIRIQIDLSMQYWNRVFEPSLRDWEAGISPNPDVWCNKYACLSTLSFERLLRPQERLSLGRY